LFAEYFLLRKPAGKLIALVCAVCSPKIRRCRQHSAGTANPTVLADCIYLTRKYRLLAAANFELVAIGVFEKEGVVTRAVALANLRPLKVFPASVAHKFRNPIHFFACVRPKRDTCTIRFVVFIRTEAKEFRRLVTDSGKKSMEGSTGLFVNESKLGQKFSVKLFRRFHVFHPQIDVIKTTRFHVSILNGMTGYRNASDRKR
jgi:hypothetical protein